VDRAIVPIVYTAELVALLREEGVPAGDVLKRTGISRRQLLDPEGLITHLQQVQVYENALALSSKPGLGLRLGARWKVGHHGVLGHALLCAQSLRHELRILVRYLPIRSFLLDFRFQEEAGIAILSAHDIMPLGPVHQVVVEEVLASLATELSDRNPPVHPTEIRVDYLAPGHRVQYEELYECPIRFAAEAVEFRFPSEALDAPSEMSNAEMVRICEERCQAILERLGPGGRIVDRVRSHIVAEPHGSQLDAVATRMAIAPRTLRRRLREEGTTFRGVLADVRKGLALDYLESSHLPLGEIAALLGYEDPANFGRAFRKWVGEAPGRYRRRTLARGWHHHRAG
jgi:AraC-like DNA-binding protein